MAVIRSPFPDITIPEVPLHELILTKIKEYGDKVALVDSVTGRSYKYSDLPIMVRQIGSALTKLGMKKGDIIAFHSPNTPEYPVMLLGALAIGAVVTTVNPIYTKYELVHHIKDSGARYVYTVEPFVELVKFAASETNIKTIVVLGHAKNCVPFEWLVKDNGSHFPHHVTFNVREDIVVLPYSSGTTGLPKGVMLTHYNLVSNVLQFSVPGIMKSLESMGVDQRVLLAFLPFFHIYGLAVLACRGLYNGEKLVTLPKFEPQAFLEAIPKYKVNWLALVPPVFLFMAKSPMVDNYDMSSIQEVGCGAAPLGKDVQEEFIRKLKSRHLRDTKQGFGMTESSGVISMQPVDDRTTGSVGVLVPNAEAMIVDVVTKKPLHRGKTGEVWVRGPQMFKGYLNKPQATAETIDENGWVHTGDIGYFNENDTLFIVDRLKELIKYKAFQVPPAELEALLLSHPKVADVGVIGIPSVESGELPKAYVVKKPGVTLTAREIQVFVQERAAPYKQLRGGVEFIEQIPKSLSGKILRRDLKKLGSKSKL